MKSILITALAVSYATAFSPVQPRVQRAGVSTKTEGGLQPLFMGRAAAVRAATKSKTDAKKAKTNGKQAGSERRQTCSQWKVDFF